MQVLENVLEEYALTNRLAEMDAGLKVALVLGTLALNTVASDPIAPLFVAISMSAFVILLAGIPAREYLSLLLVPVPFLLLSFLALLFSTGQGAGTSGVQTGGMLFGISADALRTAVNAVARTIGGICALLFLALTTPVVELFSVLRRCRIPQEFIDLAMLVYRCTFLLLGEAIALTNAQRMRQGYSGFRNSLNCLAMIGSVLFIRAWERGEELMVAMEARCYDGGHAMLPGGGRANQGEIVAVIGYLVCLALLVILPHMGGPP